jgi:hypothetical protein
MEDLTLPQSMHQCESERIIVEAEILAADSSSHFSSNTSFAAMLQDYFNAGCSAKQCSRLEAIVGV